MRYSRLGSTGSVATESMPSRFQSFSPIQSVSGIHCSAPVSQR